MKKEQNLLQNLHKASLPTPDSSCNFRFVLSFLLALSTALFLSFAASYAGAAIPETERNALIELYQMTNGQSWTRNDNWLGEPGTEDTWYGVVVENDTVRSIKLEENNLTGTLPASIADLTSLYALSLYENNLSGNIPPAIGSLKNLVYLYLCCQEFSGTIPPELGNLENLVYLHLQDNRLTGSIPEELGNLHNLKELWLDHNGFSGTIPSSLSSIGGLEQLYLGKNNFTGSIPSFLGSMHRLVALELSGNQFSGAIPAELASLGNLESLYLDSNELSGQIPSFIGQFQNLITLNLSYNSFSGAIPSALGNLHRLEHMFINENQLQGEIPAAFSELANLKALELGGNQLGGSFPQWVGGLENLTYLRLSDNQLAGTLPPSLGSLDNLVYMDIGRNQLTGNIPSELGTLHSLETLSLEYNQFTGSIPSSLGNLQNLVVLSLFDNQLSGEIPESLGNLTNLETLYLCCNNLSGSIPSVLSNLSHVKKIHLQENELTGPIPSAIGNLNNLEELWLHDNHLTGSIPHELGNLASLKYLLLDSNQLAGPVPSSLANLTQLSNEATSFAWNALYTNDPSLEAFLDSKEAYDQDFSATQTIAPKEVTAGKPKGTSIEVSWEPIEFRSPSSGGYEVHFSTAQEGPYTLFGMTQDLHASSLVVTGLEKTTTYYFQVRSYSFFDNTKNELFSAFTEPVSASTLSDDDQQPSPSPNPPVPVYPADNAFIGEVSAVKLEVGDYSSPDGDAHVRTHWFIRPHYQEEYHCTAYDGYDPSFTAVTETGDLTTHTVTGLHSGNRYVWMAAYEDENGGIAFSQEKSFITGTPSLGLPIHLPGGNTPFHLKMVSFCRWPGTPFADSLFHEEIQGNYGTHFRIGSYDPAIGAYRQYGSDLVIEPGRAYWVLARNDWDISLLGVETDTEKTLLVNMFYNKQTQDGWNMIAPPANNAYYWEKLEVMQYGPDGCTLTVHPVPIGESDGQLIDTRLWRWENGDYSADTEILAPHSGYWVYVKKEGVILRFPPSARASDYATGLLRQARERISDSLPELHPPAPIGALSGETGNSGHAGAGSGGCFMQTIHDK